jgi:hypothetical protein
MVTEIGQFGKVGLSRSESAALAPAFLRKLHAGTSFFYYSTPAQFASDNGKKGSGFEQDWRATGGEFLAPRASWVDGKHVYMSVYGHRTIPTTNGKGVRKAQKWVRGTGANIEAINCLYAEVDAKDTVRQDEWLPFYVAPDMTGLTRTEQRGALQRAETAALDAALPLKLEEYKQRAFDAIKNAPVPASVCVDSGGGWQAYWFLSETLYVTDDNRAQLQFILKAWVALVGGDGGVHDLTRVLRLPGTVNRKPKYGPSGHDVTFVWCNLDVAYTFAELAAYVPAMPEKRHIERKRIYVPAGLDADLGTWGDVPVLPRHSAIEAYNAATNLHDLLLSCGYTDAGGDRMNRPGGTTAGVELHDGDTASVYSSADPLWCDHKQRITPAHVLCVFEYDGNVNAMLDALTDGEHSKFSARLDAVRHWGLTTNFSAVCPDLLVTRSDGKQVYLTDGPDTQVWDALCDLWAEAGEFRTKPVGKQRLGKQAGVSKETAKSGLSRLSRIRSEAGRDVLTLQADDDGYGHVIALNCFVWADLATSTVFGSTVQVAKSNETKNINAAAFSELTVNEYTPRKARDAYQTGVSRFVRNLMREAMPGDWWYRPEGDERDAAGDLWDKIDGMTGEAWEAQRDEILASMDVELQRKPKPTKEQRAWDKERRGLGETGLRIMDCILRYGGMTAQELSDETGKSISAIRNGLSRLYAFMPSHLAKERDGARGPVTWYIYAEAFDEAESRTGEMKTHMLAASREDRRLEQAQLWAHRQESLARGEAEQRKAAARLHKLTCERAEVLAAIYGGATTAEAYRMASELPVKQWTAARAELVAVKQANEERAAFMERADHVANLHADDLRGLSRDEASRILRTVGYDAAEANALLNHLAERGDVLTGTGPLSPYDQVWTDNEFEQYTQEMVIEVSQGATCYR